MTTAFSVRGQYVDIQNRDIFPAEIQISNKRIKSVKRINSAPKHYLLPGFIDAHVHIESSLLVPSEFARLAVLHGTVATVSDPHEIANVCGVQGIDFMVKNGKQTGFKFFFGAPSCVPATPFETAGATISPSDIAHLFEEKGISYLAEMMNWPGVLAGEKKVMEKIELARNYGKPVDGHAPGLKGKDAARYAAAGISTDHECMSMEEGRDKIACGMKVAIREGSAARNFDALIDLMDESPRQLMFCADDKHPDSLLEGHINQLVARAIALGKDLFDVLRAACITPVTHYGLDVGLMKEGDPADFIIVGNLTDFIPRQTYIDGKLAADLGISKIQKVSCQPINHFNTGLLTDDAFEIKSENGPARIIQALDRQLITKTLSAEVKTEGGKVMADTSRDILKIAVINRYEPHVKPQVALIKGFGLTQGAIASSVAHDSHNLIVVGCSDETMIRAANLIISKQGGLSAASAGRECILPLPVAGLMSHDDAFEVARKYTMLDKMAKEMGATLQSPFMTLSFMALLVIPQIKISDKGLFDGNTFQFVSLFENKSNTIN
ncbi:Adenine deaminase [Cyclobacterium lianum]|uniref:Adenine deaminase n=1 Tax=Cyclobacterium lianum TaxID=388280 RepID=A0A1M7Q2Z4_9BACT|nr:adenine deaminase [Cyclobacterium lianum]SHN24565.1 Adenine deaminase [Cyclobacterium lianum]